MKKFRLSVPIADIWRPLVLSLLGVAVAAGLLGFRLSTLTPGLSAGEAEFAANSRTISQVIENPLHLTQKAGHWLLLKVGVDETLATRLPSAAIGLLAVIAFFLVLQQWHTTRIALLGTALFATSSWFLHVSRLGGADASFLMPLFLGLGGIWLHKKEHRLIAPLVAAAAAALLLYVPAMVWLVIPAAIWQWRRIIDVLRLLPIWRQALTIAVALVLLAPLIWGLSQDPNLIPTWLGAPESWPKPLDFLKNLAYVPNHIFVRGAGDPVYGLGRLQLLDVFTSIMILFGVYAYAFRLKLDRTRLVLGAGLVGALLIALNGPVLMSLMLPFIYILAAAGVALLLQRWFTVFPRNPFARNVAVVIMAAAVGVTSFYHLNSYFVAWPNAPETKAVFQRRL